MILTLYEPQSQRYYFQDGEDLYEGEPGAEMGGQMRYIGKGALCASLFVSICFSDSHRVPTLAPPPPPPGAARQNDRLAWRQLAPFFLIIGVFMLLVYKYVISAGAHPPPAPPPVACPDGLDRYVVHKGDTCWEIARTHRWTVDELVAANKEVDCGALQIDRELCVPAHNTH